MKPEEPKTTELINGISKRLRSIRLSKGLKLQDLAQLTGFTKSYLSQIENSKREPPISTLAKIAYVLDADVTYLITGEKQFSERPKSLTIVRKGERRAHYGPFGDKEYLYESISHNRPGRLMDAYIITIGPEFPPKPFTHEGQEIVYVLEGSQEFVYDGQTYFFNPGDCYYFDSKKTHYARTVGEKPGKILMVFAMQKTSFQGEILPLNRIDKES